MVTLHHAAAHLAHEIATTDLGQWLITQECFATWGGHAYQLPPELMTRWWEALLEDGVVLSENVLDLSQDGMALRVVLAAERVQPTPSVIRQTLFEVLAADEDDSFSL